MASHLLWILPTFIGKVPLPESRIDTENEIGNIDFTNNIAVTSDADDR